MLYEHVTFQTVEQFGALHMLRCPDWMPVSAGNMLTGNSQTYRVWMPVSAGNMLTGNSQTYRDWMPVSAGNMLTGNSQTYRVCCGTITFFYIII